MGEFFSQNNIIFNLFTISCLILLGINLKDLEIIKEGSSKFYIEQGWPVGAATTCLVAIQLTYIGFQALDWDGRFSLDFFKLFLGPEIIFIGLLWLNCRFYQQSILFHSSSSQSLSEFFFLGIKWLLFIQISFQLFLAYVFGHQLEDSQNTPIWKSNNISGVLGFWLFISSFFRLGFMAVLEEVCFRGLLFGSLRRHMRFRPAMGISTFLFVLQHDQGILGVLMTAVAGYLFCFLYEKYCSLVPGIIVHIGWNLFFNLHWVNEKIGRINSSEFHFWLAILSGVGLIIVCLLWHFLGLERRSKN